MTENIGSAVSVIEFCIQMALINQFISGIMANRLIKYKTCDTLRV